MAFPSGWAWKAPITIPLAQIAGTNTNFPVLLTEVNFPTAMMDGGADSALNGGGDVRFSEDAAGTFQLPCEVVSFVTGGTPSAEVWVKFPTLNSGADKTVYVWYKKAGEVQPVVTTAFGRNAVWSLCDLVSHGSHLHIDSSGNIANAAVSGTITTANTVFGLTAGNFNASGDAVNWGNQPSVMAGRSEFSTTLIYNQPGVQPLYANTLRYDGIFNVQWDATGIRYVLWTPAVQTPYLITGANPANTDLIHQYYYDGMTRGLEVNGGVLTNFSAAGSGLIGTTSNPLMYGAKNTSGGEQWHGDIALVIFWKTARTSSWRTTEYNNQSSPSTFATAGTPLASGGGGTLSPDNGADSHMAGNVTLSQAQTLTVQMGRHSQTADNVTLYQGVSLAANSAVSALSSDTAAMAQTQTLSPANAAQTQMADNVALSQNQTLFARDSTHSLSSDTVTLAQMIQALVVQNATHGLVSGNVTFNPLAIQQSADRKLTLQASSRTSLLTGGDRTIRPTNNRTLRI